MTELRAFPEACLTAHSTTDSLSLPPTIKQLFEIQGKGSPNLKELKTPFAYTFGAASGGSPAPPARKVSGGEAGALVCAFTSYARVLVSTTLPFILPSGERHSPSCQS
jgi:hypothetical protein